MSSCPPPPFLEGLYQTFTSAGKKILLQNRFLEPQASAISSALGAWQRNGERREQRSLAVVAVLHRWIFQAMRYPPQNLPPFSHSQRPVAGRGGMGKKKKKFSIFPIALILSMPWNLKGRGRCGHHNCKGQVLPILSFLS